MYIRIQWGVTSQGENEAGPCLINPNPRPRPKWDSRSVEIDPQHRQQAGYQWCWATASAFMEKKWWPAELHQVVYWHRCSLIAYLTHFYTDFTHSHLCSHSYVVEISAFTGSTLARLAFCWDGFLQGWLWVGFALGWFGFFQVDFGFGDGLGSIWVTVIQLLFF